MRGTHVLSKKVIKAMLTEPRLRRRYSGYVALAVVGDKGALSKDLTTSCGNDRNANMVAFAIEALKLVKEYISTNADKDKGGKM